MDPKRLDKIIKRFWANERRNDKYYLGVCSEVAVALKRFTGGGKISKAGLMHTFFTYNGYYCDIRGCFAPNKYRSIVPAPYYRPAEPKEIAHINNLLEHDTVAYILAGLRQAQREI